MDWPTFAMVGRTFSDVFPESILVTTDPYGRPGPDFLLVGFKDSKNLNPKTAAANLLHAQKSQNMELLNPALFFNLIMSEDLKYLFGTGPINTDNRPYLEFQAPKLVHQYSSNSMIADRIKSNTFLSKQTASIISHNMRNVDSQIDFIAYALSFNANKTINIDLSSASQDQKDRYSKLIEKYCADNVIHDFSFIKDEGLRNRCVPIYVERVKKTIAASHDRKDKASGLYYLGSILSINGKPSEAVQYFLEMLEIEPGSQKAGDALTSALQVVYYDAVEKLSERIEKNPNNPVLYYQLGEIYQKYGKFNQAVSEYNKALTIFPTFLKPARGLNKIAVTTTKAGNYKIAIDAYNTILSARPDNPDIYYNLACLYSKQNKIKESMNHLKKAVDKGYDNLEKIKTDKDLDLARKSPEYREMLNNIEDNL